MTVLEETRKAKSFLNGIDLLKIKETLNKINFNARERELLPYILDKLTVKEIAIELNLSPSYISFLKQTIYRKIATYLDVVNYS